MYDPKIEMAKLATLKLLADFYRQIYSANKAGILVLMEYGLSKEEAEETMLSVDSKAREIVKDMATQFEISQQEEGS